MPRKPKDEEELNIKEKKASTAKKATASKKQTETTKKATTKTAEPKTEKKPTTSSKKSAVTKETTTNTKTAKSKATATSSKKSAATKKATTNTKTAKPKTTATSSKKPTTTKKATTKRASKKVAIPVEYYDLPAVYNKTMVKILAQTPSCLFVYWEISENDHKEFQKQYGDRFFQDTKPYLVITNETMNYSFETEINDYANSWYIHINDSDCKYIVNLIRKPINYKVPISATSINISSSNEMDAPNDHILFDELGKTVFFRNVKNDVVTEKDISSLSFISNIGRIYNIYDLYKEIYKNELNGDELGVKLSSSQSSSFFKQL